MIRDNLIEDNLATGFWMDISVYDATLVNNVSRRNESFGFFHEISANALFAGNVVVGNADGGIAISNASQVRVINNTLVANCWQSKSEVIRRGKAAAKRARCASRGGRESFSGNPATIRQRVRPKKTPDPYRVCTC